MTGLLNFDPLQSGDPCIVIFDGTTPDLAATFQRFISADGTIVVTTPQGENDPDLQTVHYVDDFQYLAAGVAPVQINEDIAITVGANVTFYFGTYNVPGTSDVPWTITGTITAINPSNGLIQLDVGGTTTVVKDYWYVEIL